MAKRTKARAKKGGSGLELNHAMVYVLDLAAALRFYSGQLGFKMVDEHPGAYARLLAPKGNASIGLHVATAEQGVSSEGVRLYLEVKDLDGFCEKLQGEGVQFTKLPAMMPWGWRHAYLNDPDGHEISLYWAGRKRLEKTKMSRGASA
jgi:catechol 2,3-dioxygenase-like lactoylglutathione lyase family enzyme